MNQAIETTHATQAGPAELSPAPQQPLPRGSLTWFEIPTGDIHRAAEFFRTILASPLVDATPKPTPDAGPTASPEAGATAKAPEPMFLFPTFDGEVGGALVERQDQKPGPGGTLVYLRIDGALADAMARVEPAGGALITPALRVPNVPGTFCVIRDSEGNHVGLHAAR